MSAAILSIFRFTLACGFALIALNHGRAAAQVSQIIDVQVYENTTVFPGEFRYFMTARASDKAYLAANPQMAWKPLYTFSAFAADSAPADAVPVCRFYLPTLATHFYSAQPAECAQFKRDPLFVFEGNDFYVTLPRGTNVQTATCAASDAPVYRAYNEGARRNVSGNHIFGTDFGLANYLATNAGWRYEGVVMCVPKARDATNAVILAGRATVVRSAGEVVEPLGMPIVQAIDPATLKSRMWVDPLRGESDWLARTAFDPIRGKLYLVRGTTIQTQTRWTGIGVPAPTINELITIRSTRDEQNVLEFDVSTGTARYLRLRGSFTDAHFNPTTRLLLLVGTDSQGSGSLQWFDPVRDAVVDRQTLEQKVVDLSITHVDSPLCDYAVRAFTLVMNIGPDIFGISYSPTAFPTGKYCVSANRVVRPISDTDDTVFSSSVKIGDVILSIPPAGVTSDSGLVRFRANDFTMIDKLPRANLPPPPPLFDSGHYGTLRFFAADGDLLVLLQRLYLTGTPAIDFANYRYFMLRYRDATLLESVGPLVTTSRELWSGPAALLGVQTKLVRRVGVQGGELWTLTPSSPPPRRIMRADATTYRGLGEISLDVPSAQLHLQ